jgi:pentatricopeptide repeat protein
MLSHHLTRRSLRIRELYRPRLQRSAIAHERRAEFPSLRAFSDSLINKSDNPRSQLSEWYNKEHEIKISYKSSFFVDDHFHDGKIWWSARFVCPLTNQIYYADSPASYANPKSPWIKDDDVAPIHFEGKVFFSKLKTAVHAAAARRLDAIESSPQGINLLKGSPSSDALVVSAEENIAAVDIGSMEISAVPLEADNSMEENADSLGATTLNVDSARELATTPKPSKALPPPGSPSAHGNPMDTLSIFYSRMKIPKFKDGFDTIMHKDKHIVLWTATFVCPITGKKYRSGTLRDESHYGEASYLKGTPYYTRRKSAVHAAAARAIDDMMFTSTNDTNLPRLCFDDPSQPPKKFVHPHAADRQLTEPEDDISLRRLEEEPLEETASQSLLTQISFTVQSNASTSATTLGRVMTAWANTVALESDSLRRSSGPTLLPSTWTPLQERRKICAEALSWLTAANDVGRPTHRHVRFHCPLHVNPLEVGNAILSALARANEIENGRDVQELAAKVLNYLANRTNPNADTYAAYFRCLHGVPTSVASTAQKILEQMISGELVDGKGFPAPTLEVFNTVIRLWADAGNSEKCHSVLDLLVSSGFVANRDTCYAMLSVMAHRTFDSDAANDLIKRMGIIDALDAEIFCAPLRWSGKHVGARRVPWDNVSEIFRDGFKESATEDTAQEARAVEAWVSNMESVVEVNTTSCYEAAIQAWVRTGTLEGLLRAEACAQDLLASTSKRDGMQPSLQCFFPILAAWTHSGEDSSNLKRWIHRLESSGISQSDGRVPAMLILASRRRAEALLLSSSQYDIAEGKLLAAEAFKELSSVCDQLINHHFDEEDLPFFLEASAFCDAISCIGCFGKQRAEHDDREQAKAATELILQVVVRYQKLIQRLSAAVCERDQLNERVEFLADAECSAAQSDEVDQQLRYLLQGAAGVYHSAIACLDDIDLASPATEEACEGGLAFPETLEDCEHVRGSLLLTRLPDIEGMVRHEAECSMLLKSLGDCEGDGSITYPDGFSLHEKDLSSKVGLLAKVLDSLARRTTGHQFSDQARILWLVVNLASEKSFLKSDHSKLPDLFLDAAKVLLAQEQIGKEHVVTKHILKVLSHKIEETSGLSGIDALLTPKVADEQRRPKANAAGFASPSAKVKAGHAKAKVRGHAFSKAKPIEAPKIRLLSKAKPLESPGKSVINKGKPIELPKKRATSTAKPKASAPQTRKPASSKRYSINKAAS